MIEPIPPSGERAMPWLAATLLAVVLVGVVGCAARQTPPESAAAEGRDAATAPDPTARYSAACRAGDPEGCYNLGINLEKGRGVAIDLSGAREAYEQGCDGGFAMACTNLGYLHEHGIGLPADEVRAAGFYGMACESNELVSAPDPIGCSNLAVFHRRGSGGIDVDASRAAELFASACDGGLADACANLGTMFGGAEGVEQDDVRAAALYRRACDGGSLLGCYNLGVVTLRGAGVPTDPSRAAALFRQGCDGGDAYACYELGALSLGDRGIAADRDAARRAFERACELGDARGCQRR